MKQRIINSRLVLLGLGLALAGVARAAFDPIPLTADSFNEDVIVEKEATPKLQLVTTASLDQGTNNGAATWMEAGFDRVNPARGLPAPGTPFAAISNANYTFQMAPDYTAPNGIMIDDEVPGGTFTLVSPATYTKLSFLTSGGNGGHIVGVTVHYQDGSSQTDSFTSPDWFGNTEGVAVIAGGRVDTTRNFNTQDNGANPRLYFRDINLNNASSPVTSIDLYRNAGNAGAHSDVVAVSGAATEGGTVNPIDVTGYTYDFIIEKEAPARQRIVTTSMEGGTNIWATTQTMENQNNTSWTYYEKGYNIDNPSGNGFAPNPAAINTGVPAPGSNVTNSLGDHIFTLPADYAANNACFLTTGSVNPALTNRTITFVTPTTASVLSFLASAGGGAATLDVVIHHQDASTETTTMTVPDWYNTGANWTIGPNGRVSADNADFSTATLNPNGLNQPRIFNVDLLVSDASPVTSIDLTHRDTGGQVGIFAVSGTTEPVAPVFVTQPQSQKVNVGENVSFTVEAVANVPISYQWQMDDNGTFVDMTDGAGVSGTTTANLMLTSVLDQDYPDVRCMAMNAAGSATSATASLLVISPLLPVTIASDLITAYAPDTTRGYPGGEAPPKAIDGTTDKYLHFGNNPIHALGFDVAPSQGRSIVTAIRLTAANDAAERRPANVILEGSNDSGVSYTLIYSNAISIQGPDVPAGQGLDPLTQTIGQVRFENTNSYTSYRWYTTQLQGNVDLMQIAEVELLGVIDTSDPSPYFITQPVPTAVYEQGSAFFSVYALGTPFPDVVWQKQNNGVFEDLSDGGSISGSHTEVLTVNPAGFADAGNYRAVASNTAGAIPSVVVPLTVVSTNEDVTMPEDPITSFGDEGGGQYNENGGATNTIDNFNTIIYINAGSGVSAAAGFPPFQGPVGVVVTPGVGYTRLAGLRVYTSTEGAGRDPNDYVLEGSNDAGSTYDLISQGPLNLPLARGTDLYAFNPIDQPMQEILFTSPNNYSTYKVTFNHTRDDENQSALSIGELELLGVPSGPPEEQPVLSITPNGSGGFTIDSTISGNVYSTTNLLGTVIWTLEGPTPLEVNPSPTDSGKYFQIQP